ncbi:hypothetical protein Lal_00049587 [Lupinus albus]|uniref:Putative premnaspirodiene oxygenase n=1 Tax=Lupinus albus TaxID=3870 RepID=A0A6A4PLV8_LUPAL|nr:putative premnaspirodiene oxygenase [Lupinus albus]KAF1867158.1 hypothetical protein Lal_00049587 [Lupinus albus]
MELFSSFQLVLIFCLSLLLWLAKSYKNKTKVKLPPGPRKLPLIGNLHQLACSGSLPHRTLRDLAHKYGPLMHLQLGEIPTLVVSSPEMAKEIMKTHDLTFAQRPKLLASEVLFYGSTDIAYSPLNDYWRQMRKICTLELLSAKRVQSFSSIRHDEVDKLIKSIHLSQGSSFNLSQRLFSLVSTIVSRAVFGKKSEHQDELISLLQKGVELTGGFDVADFFPSLKPIHFITGMKGKLEDVHNKLDMMLENIIMEHQENITSSKHVKGEAFNEKETENIVNVLLCIKENGSFQVPVTNDNIKAIIWDIFGAGTDTSSTSIEWAMSELMKNPTVRRKLQVEIREAFKGKETINEKDLSKLSYFKSVIKETMRLHTVVPLLVPRESKESCKIGEYQIPKKTRVIVNAWALARDPNYWYDADKFIPERFDNTNYDFNGNNFEFLPFGSGRRICPGILLGLANMELPLAALLYHFDWELPNGMNPQDLDMSETFGSAVVKKNNLYVIPTSYNYSSP